MIWSDSRNYVLKIRIKIMEKKMDPLLDELCRKYPDDFNRALNEYIDIILNGNNHNDNKKI